jgi:hypothetical protein
VRKIVIELSPQGCKKALDELDEYKKSIRPKLDEICKRLAELGAAEAQRRFNKGAQEENGGTVVTVRRISNGYAIHAEGANVYFVEFGTGVATDAHGYTPLVDVYPGSWSEEHAKQYSTYGYWWYRNVKYDGTPAYMPMYYAGKVIRENERRIAREVFGRR